MRDNYFAKRIAPILLLLCMIIVILSPIAVKAEEQNHIGIAVNENHKTDLIELFKTETGSLDYSAKQHTVELIIGSEQHLSVVSTLNEHQNVKWISSNSTIASITDDGVLKAIKEGTTTVTAICGQLSASITVTVVKGFALNHTNARLSINKLCNLDIATSGDLTKYIYYTEWDTTNESLALVGKGLVLASRTGTGEIIAYVCERGTDKQVGVAHCSIEVLPDITSVVIVNKASRLELGSTMQLNVKTLPERQPVIWESSDNSIATVSENGVLNAVGVGTVTISAYAGVWNDNVYNKVDRVFSEVTIEIWSDATTKYNVTVNKGARGEISTDKKTALAGEKVTITTTISYDKNGNQIEAFGATALSIVDENGMAVTATNEGSGTFTFLMPKSPVSISAVYSALYGVSCETALKANFARNENLVGKLIVNEYVGGSFSGGITFSSPNITLSNVSATHGEVIKNLNGTVSVLIDKNRDVATDITFLVYADSQTISNGSHSISVSGDLQMTIDNSFVACTVGEFAKDALIVDMDYISNMLAGSTLTLNSNSQIVIYGEALNYIMSNYISMELMFDVGTIAIPYSSLSEVEVEQGDFTIISMVHSNDVFHNEKTLGKYSLSARTYTNTGSSKNQMTMIGKISVHVNGSDDSLLTLQTGSQTISANKNGVFEMPTMAGLETFTVLIGEGGISLGNVISTILIVILIIALIVAVVFLLKRMQIIKFSLSKTETKDSNANDENQQSNDEPDIFDEQAFKTVDDILRESNLSEELELIRNDALAEMKSEVEREISEAAISTEELKKYERVPGLKELSGISSNDVDFNELETKYLVLSDTIRIAEDARKDAMSILTSDESPTTDIINRETDKMRLATSEMVQAREEFSYNIDIALGVLNELAKNFDPLEEAKENLTNAIKTANEKSAQVFDIVIQKAKDLLKQVDDTVREVPEISSELALEMNIASSYCTDLIALNKQLTSEKSLGEAMLQPTEVYFSPEEMDTKASSIISLVNNMIELINRDHAKSMNVGAHAQSVLSDWKLAEKARIAKEQEKAKRIQAEVLYLIEQIKSKLAEYSNIQADMTAVFETLCDGVDDVMCDVDFVESLKSKIQKLKEDEAAFEDILDNVNLNDPNNLQVNENSIQNYKVTLTNLESLVHSASQILQTCLLEKHALVKKSLKNRVHNIQDSANTELEKAEPRLSDLINNFDTADSNTNYIVLKVSQNAKSIKDIADQCTDMINSDSIDAGMVNSLEKTLENLISSLYENLDDADKAIRNFREAEEAKRIAELERFAEEQRREEDMRRELERQSKIRELAQRRKGVVEVEALSANHKKLVEQFEECVKLIANEHKANTKYLETIGEESKTDDHKCLANCSSILYQNANEAFASNYWEMPDSLLSQLICVMKQDVELIIYIRSILTGEAEQQTIPAFKIQRLPRKKLRYWQNQMESRNPYVALLAMVKLENHKLRVKRGVIAHQANNTKK